MIIKQIVIFITFCIYLLSEATILIDLVFCENWETTANIKKTRTRKQEQRLTLKHNKQK